MKVSDILRDIFAFWGSPSERDLPPEDCLAVINRQVNARLMDLQLTDKNYLAKLSPIIYTGYSGNSRVAEVPIADLSAVVRVESRTANSTSEADWEEEQIADFGAWNDAQSRPQNSVAFVGGVPGGLLMHVNRPANNREFRLMYETGGVSLSGLTATLPRMQESFRPVLFYPAAAECGMMLAHLDAEGKRDRSEKVAFLLSRETDARKNWEKFINMNRAQSVTYREAFNESRTGDIFDTRWWRGAQGSDGADTFNTHIYDGGTP